MLFLLRHGAIVFQSLIGWWKPTINSIFYFHILLLLLFSQWLKIDTQVVNFHELFSRHLCSSRWQCATRNSILFSNLSHIGCCIYDCNDHNSHWTDWYFKFQTWYFVITSTIYIDLMLLRLKNHFALSKFLLYKFCYIQVSLLWKWLDVWPDQLTTSS